jgi:hypothetical protein
MKPSQLASQLRRIASAIDNSKQPDRTLVARDLKKVLAGISHSSKIVINSYSNIAIRTPDVRGQLKKWLMELSGEVMGVDGETVTAENIDSQLSSVDDDMIGETFDGFLVCSDEDEGTEGIAVGFSSSDRSSFAFPWPVPEVDGFWGNGDPVFYKTVGVADGVEIKGEDVLLSASSQDIQE